MPTWAKFLIVLVLIVVIAASIFFGCTPMGVTVWNNWWFGMQKADDATNYETLKRVEDTCRAMIASYDADVATYNQYKDSDEDFGKQLAASAKISANRTASTYNAYILKNNFVWKGGVPSDIRQQLPILN